MAKIKRPSFQFYPGDWLNDARLRMVSVGARGLWIEMICLMHQGSEYGFLKVADKVILNANLARMCGATLQEVEGWVSELEQVEVFSRDANGCIYSRRMIRDEEVRQARAAGGKLGGNPALKDKNKVNLNTNLPPTPSSSSSSSSSTSVYKEKSAKASPVARPPEVSEQVWDDWQKLRKAKKAPVTETVVKSARREAEKANLSFENFLELWCARGSQGLQADWIKPEERGRPQLTEHQRREDASARAIFGHRLQNEPIEISEISEIRGGDDVVKFLG